MYSNIPEEMRNYPQWCVWRMEDRDASKPTKVPYQINGKLAKVDNPDTWTDYYSAVHAVSLGGYDGIGFMLTPNDPYSIIDLDDTKGNTEQRQRQQFVFEQFYSYAERSPSGNGLHIIVRGKVPSGCRRDNIEVYSDKRYMTMTGDVLRPAPINDHQQLLNVLWEQINAKRNAHTGGSQIDEPQTIPDEDVIARARNAANGEKFAELFEGQWQKYYGSQSDADFALIDIIQFYTKNREQITRIFRTSQLGQRKKAYRQDYINTMLNRSFDHALPPVDMDGLRNMMEAAIAKRNTPLAPKKLTAFSFDASKVDPETGDAIPTPQPINPNLPPTLERSAQKINDDPRFMPPPGLIGDIAEWIYQAAPRPVREIALAGAISLMAGICGRAYNVSGGGLNSYVMLLAATGAGKEAISSGINTLMTEVAKTEVHAMQFIGPGRISSAQGLHKHLAKSSKSFVSIIGEVGLMLQTMAAERAPDHKKDLQSALLDYYNKSGAGNRVAPSVYSDREKNVEAVLNPAVTIMGESTPEEFYKGLDEGMISSGLLPRFNIIEYNGPRVPFNKGRKTTPPRDLVEKMVELCKYSVMLNAQETVIPLEMESDAEALADKFGEHCDDMINSADADAYRQLWNRSHFKVLKLAGLVAVGIRPLSPKITKSCVEWAINLVLADVQAISTRFKNGLVGGKNEVNEQNKDLQKAVNKYFVSGYEAMQKWIIGSMYDDRVVPYKYLQNILVNMSSFKNARNGATNAVKQAIKSAIDSGDLVELTIPQRQKYGNSALMYMVANPAAFGL